MRKIEKVSQLLADLNMPFRHVSNDEIVVPTGTLIFQDPTKSYYGLDSRALSSTLLIDMSAEDSCLHILEENGKIYWVVALNETWEDGGSKLIL